MTARTIALRLALGAALLGACGSGGAADDATAPKTPTALRVFAATSLQAVFTELETSFKEANDDVDVELTFGGSSGLAAQIRQGAPAHVLATADQETMRTVVPDDAPTPPVVFARNRLAIVVEPGNPERISSLRDLARPEVVVVLCAPEVPCGRLAALALERAGVAVEARSLEENVGGVRAKVELGEADAGIVYVTDARTAGASLTAVDDPVFGDPSLEAVYPMAVLEEAPADAAAAWVAHVRSETGRAALSRAGFRSP